MDRFFFDLKWVFVAVCSLLGDNHGITVPRTHDYHISWLDDDSKSP